MNKEKILIICIVVIIFTCLMASFTVINHNNSKENNLEASNDNLMENSSENGNVIPQDENYHQYAADWYESYHFGGRYHGSHSENFIATHDIFALTETPDGTYVIVAGDGCYYYVD